MALAAASAGTVAMWPASATSSAQSGPAQAAAGELPHSTGQVMQIRAVYQAKAVRAAQAAARKRAVEHAKLMAERAAQKRAAQQAAQEQAQQAQEAQAAQPAAPSGPSGSPQQIAQSMLSSFGWGQDQWGCLDQLWQQESGWSLTASNPSGAYGIPQALPGSKMASAGPNWEDNAATQIKWGLGYIQSKFGSPCAAWSNEESSGYY
jgi:hypothetical protein